MNLRSNPRETRLVVDLETYRGYAIRAVNSRFGRLFMVDKINVGSTIEQQLRNDLQLEYDAVKRLNDGIKTCEAANDNGSRELLKTILVDEEHHIDWLEGQLYMIKEMTYENYLAQQLGEGEES